MRHQILAQTTIYLIEAGYKNQALRLLQAALHTALSYRETPVDPSTDIVDLFIQDLKRHHDTRRSFIEVKPFFRNPKLWAPFQGRIKGADEKHLAYWVDKAKDLGISLEKSHMWDYMPSIPGGVGRHYFVSKKTMGHRDLVFVLELNLAYNRFVLSIRPLEELDPEVEEEEDESWKDFLEGNEYLGLDEFEKLAKEKNIEHQKKTFANGSSVILFSIDNDKYIADLDNDEMKVYSASDWMDNKLDFATDLIKVYNLEDFWDSPPTLYHATDQDSIKSILESGLRMKDESRGVTNSRLGEAVFTSRNPKSIAHYGNTILEINMEAMKRAGYTPRVSLEPGIVAWEATIALRNAVGLDDDDYSLGWNPYGMKDDTVIVYGDIPAKYLTVMD